MKIDDLAFVIIKIAMIILLPKENLVRSNHWEKSLYFEYEYKSYFKNTFYYLIKCKSII